MGSDELVRDGAERALAAFYERLNRGKVPKRRRYARVVGGVVGSQRHQFHKRQQQRKNAFNWRYRDGPRS